jgi:hypothetical protein
MTLLLVFLIAGFTATGASLGWFGMPSFFTEILIFFGLFNSVLYWILARKQAVDPADFVKIYLGVTVLRLLIFGGFIYALILLDKPGAPKNALFFLIGYFLFTLQEVWTLFRKIDAQKMLKSGQKDP